MEQRGDVGIAPYEILSKKPSVEADAYIGPPGLIQHLLLTVSL